MLLSHTDRAAQAATVAEADAAANDAAANDDEASSSGGDGAMGDAAMTDAPTSTNNADGEVAAATPARSPAKSATDGRVRLRRCSDECCTLALGNVGGLGQLLDCCAHSPFAWALEYGYVERALWLYNASFSAEELSGSSPANDSCRGIDSTDGTLAFEQLRLAASVLAGSHPTLPDGQEVAVAYPTLAKVPLRQMLLVLAARRVLPTAAMSAQRAAALAACGTTGWPTSATDLGYGSRDASSGAEPLATPECAATEPLPPVVYCTENVPYDIVPSWPVAGRQHETGCKCKAQRTKFCAQSCACGSGNGRSECGYGCACIADAKSCLNRKMQRGLRKQLSLRHCGPDKGWGVFAAESIRRDDFVIEYVGEIISEAEAQRREKECGESWAYVFTLKSAPGTSSEPCYIDAYQIRNLAAFINFGCTPNLEARPMHALSGDRRLPRIGFFAKSDIAQGDELSYRRDLNAFSRRSWSELPCKCGAKECRKFL
uniref:Histone-lysine N-methyltransferase n=1 Tax=Haptolina brevifila TaxID=156173 RepID=A0A7S2MSG8_9EUKA|mmetsp:Transcript_57587/g.114303  ORF Transcript_57587/g.114303 Transcript_57587/m.114303 type:complete len:488 (+) Transcript_57587:220-1683(+)|eukprot:CAMPEP_0174702266 /NCGR_PEP_ID=MMETSP1094-20130205/6603_1 /TAXON_ID=156173 /ORGANISM="Chrysochromulina brevifilum, Strain UTEX LB 985" /LENGTH=487 /DNA_ID=CAMNT_0015900017 /DNA_START=182 /DNA_END=1645 /DNA_ORIENTATION=-